jgi:uncharacterized protein Yka (UPF0111/DUF47 family)
MKIENFFYNIIFTITIIMNSIPPSKEKFVAVASLIYAQKGFEAAQSHKKYIKELEAKVKELEKKAEELKELEAKVDELEQMIVRCPCPSCPSNKI